MHKKHIPMRKCSGCGKIKPKAELIRIVKAPNSNTNDKYQGAEISLDFIGKKPGRGAYLCKNSECLKLARKAKRLDKSFACKIPKELYDKLEEELLESER